MALIVRFLRLGLLVVAFFSLVLNARAKDEAGVGPRRSLDASNSPLYGPGDVYANIPEKDEFGRDQLAMFREWNSDPVGNHAANLKAINPSLAKVVRKAQVDNPRLRFVTGSGKRDYKMQQKAVAWGWSNTRDSHHRSGDAVDLWPLDAKGRVHFDPTTQSRVGAAMKKAAKELGVSIRWGGNFHGFKDMDRSHFELAPN
jgi:peptidoglycan LD-endopeptidase CwlK